MAEVVEEAMRFQKYTETFIQLKDFEKDFKVFNSLEVFKETSKF